MVNDTAYDEIISNLTHSKRNRSKIKTNNQVEDQANYSKRNVCISGGQAPIRKLHAEMLSDDPLFSLTRKK